MPTYLEWVASLPVGIDANKALLRAALTGRSAYCLDSSEDLQTLTVVDPDSGDVPLYVIQDGRNFAFDSTDTTTAHDGTTCLVSADGKRFKVETFEYPHSVLDKDLTAPPGSPSVGDRYIVGVASTGDWSGKDNQVAVYTERGWQFATIPIGKFLYVEDETGFYHRNAAGTWTAGVGSLALGAGVVKPSSIIGGGGRVLWIIENQTTTAPPGSVTDGAAYIVGASATGDWAGHDGKIAHGENSAWVIYTPAEGWIAYDKNLNAAYRYTGSAWESAAGAWNGFDSSYTASTGSTSTGGSGAYTYSDTTAPTLTPAYRRDDVGLTYTAKRSGAKLRFRYSANLAVSSSSQTFGIAIYRDSETTALAWDRFQVNSTTTVAAEFIIDASDASSHTYKIVFQTIETGVISASHRRFTVEEAA